MSILHQGIPHKKWMRRAFMLQTTGANDSELMDMIFSETIVRPFDTSPGGNEVLNPLPQFTSHCDIKQFNTFTHTLGMGRYYDEAYGLTQQKIYMRFGVPKFNSMTSFFTGFYDSGLSIYANTGSFTNVVLNYIGRAIAVSLTIFNPYMWLGTAVFGIVRILAEFGSSKYYYFQSTMHVYWNTVTTMVNDYCVKRGIVPRLGTHDDNITEYRNRVLSRNDIKELASKLEILSEDGSVDMYRYATLAHRRKKMFLDDISKIIDNESFNFDQAALKLRQTVHSRSFNKSVPNVTYDEYMEKVRKSEAWSINEGNPQSKEVNGEVKQTAPDDVTTINVAPEFDKDVNIDYSKDYQNKATAAAEAAKDTVKAGQLKREFGFWGMLASNLNDGGEFICLRVNSTGEVSESFSNSTGPSNIASSINEMSSSARSVRFDLANGNVAGPFGWVIEKAGALMSGVLEGFNISGLAALGGSALVDIPEKWESSSSSLPSQSYTLSLVSPYGNPMSQLFNMYIPMFMILAGALPRSVGKQAYTSPFLVQLYDKGKQQTRLGIIDSVSVRRGTTNLPFNKLMNAMGIEVTFSVKDLSSILHVPISENFSLNPFKGIFDEHTAFTDYMSVLAGLDLDDNVYPSRHIHLNITRKWTNMKSWFSASHAANFLANGTPVKLFKVFYKGVDPS